MSTTTTRQRNNTIAGFFVLMTAILLLVAVSVLSGLGSLLGRTHTYTARFPLNVGVPGLEEGSEVTIGGIRVGMVRKIEPEFDRSDQQPPSILVSFVVDRDYTIRQDASVGLVLPLIGSGSTLNISNLGSERAVYRGDVLRGEMADSMLLKSAGISKEQVRTVLNNINRVSDDASAITADFRLLFDSHGEPLAESIRGTVEAFELVADDAQIRWPGWADRVDQVTANIDEASQQAPSLITDARQTFTDVQGATEEVRQVVADVRPDITQTAQNVREITDEFKTDTMDQISRMLGEGETAMKHAVETIDELDQRIIPQLPEIARILGNMRIASQYLKLAMIEIRSQPWRLLYTPGTDEVRESKMHDVVRTYASAISDLDATTEALRDLYDRHGDRLDTDDPDLQLILKQLNEQFSEYEVAEDRLFDQVLNRPKDQ